MAHPNLEVLLCGQKWFYILRYTSVLLLLLLFSILIFLSASVQQKK